MSFKDKLKEFKHKNDLTEELQEYKSMISKKTEHSEFKYALNKVESAITLIKENQQIINLDAELSEFYNLREKIIIEIEKHQKFYQRRYQNLLKET
ncbi:MAG: hypothetical protein ACFFFB_18815, partial [Candidatus Heimdallarchaeota archaeon]